MNMYSLLARSGPNRIFLSLVVGALSGIMYSLLIPMVTSTLQSSDADAEKVPTLPFVLWRFVIESPAMAAAFAIACVTILITRTWSEVSLARVSVVMASRLRIDLYHRIARAPLAAIERIGQPRLMTALNNDLPKVVEGALNLPHFLMDGVTLIGLLAFLFYLNPDVFWSSIKCIVFGVVTNELIMAAANRYFMRTARLRQNLQEGVHGLVRGFKELKLSDEKRGEYFRKVLLATEQELIQVEKVAISIPSVAANYGQLLTFFMIGWVIFVFVGDHFISPQALVGVVMTLLYISSPVGTMVRVIPQLQEAKIALRRVTALFDELPEESIEPSSGPTPIWDAVRFEGVTYRHVSDQEGEGFTVGPVTAEFRKGEITFVVGGNGSGKSTLAKLLTLHYHPSGGHVHFGSHRVTREDINVFRQSISSIYSDYYLFDRLLVANRDPARVEQLLRMLGLHHKVSYQDGRFSTLSLSDGQRRRMALLAAFVEDKQLYLFDEWAADQDPTFKEVFYREILPALKADGKAVVVITHDDRYFDVADRLMVMADGQVSATRIKGEEPVGSARPAVPAGPQVSTVEQQF